MYHKLINPNLWCKYSKYTTTIGINNRLKKILIHKQKILTKKLSILEKDYQNKNKYTSKYNNLNFDNNVRNLNIELEHREPNSYLENMEVIASLKLVDFNEKYYFYSPHESVLLNVNYELFENPSIILENSEEENWIAIIEKINTQKLFNNNNNQFDFNYYNCYC